MPRIKVKFMTDEALETLRANPESAVAFMEANSKSPGWVKDFVPGDVYVAKKYDIEDFELEVPKGPKDTNSIARNAIILYEHLCDLPRYVLSDERFWAWLNFEKGYEAALAMRPMKGETKVLRNNWLFARRGRRGLLAGVLSRLYLTVEMSVDETLRDPFELSRFALEKSTRIHDLGYRSYSSARNIMLGALKAEKRAVERNKPKEIASYYQDVAKSISRKASVMLLDAMPEEEIEAFVYERCCFLIEEQKSARKRRPRRKGKGQE